MPGLAMSDNAQTNLECRLDVLWHGLFGQFGGMGDFGVLVCDSRVLVGGCGLGRRVPGPTASSSRTHSLHPHKYGGVPMPTVKGPCQRHHTLLVTSVLILSTRQK